MSDHSATEPVDILLIEDNSGDVRLTREAFKSIDSEVTFHVVTDGKEAVEFFRRLRTDESTSRPDLVLLDLNLPRMDGFDVLDVLDAELDYPPPPVLVLSSSKTAEDVVRSYQNYAKAYLTKPDDMAEFDSMAQAIEDFWIETVRHPPVPS